MCESVGEVGKSRWCEREVSDECVGMCEGVGERLGQSEVQKEMV